MFHLFRGLAAPAAAAAACPLAFTPSGDMSHRRPGAPSVLRRSSQLVVCEGSKKDSMPEIDYEVLDMNEVISGDVLLYKIPHLASMGFRSANVPNTMTTPGQVKASSGQVYSKFIGARDLVLMDIVRTDVGPDMTPAPLHAYPRAGPRETLHFKPTKVNAAIVNCGGLCPGLNDVIHHVVNTLSYNYNVDKIYGIRAGYRGMTTGEYDALMLDPETVRDIQDEGGTILGSARGGFDEDKIIAYLKKHKINQLFVVGGDGTHRGAYRLSQACIKRNLDVAVCGIPKTIDNDLALIDRSFGFQSAVEAAQIALRSAETEAKGNMPNGIGVVKLMGRSSGYIASYATLANGSVDLCLIPEVPLVLEGPNGCLPHLERVVKEKGFAVVVVAEGAGEELLGKSAVVDAGGNRQLPQVGQFMVEKIKDHFKAVGQEATVKYIDPSYIIRSVPANSEDSYLCSILAQAAVHGTMAGYTGFSVGLVNNHSVMIPIPALVAKSPRTMNPRGRSWERVLAVTRQPNTVPVSGNPSTLTADEPPICVASSTMSK